jgi:hypothetical protein
LRHDASRLHDYRGGHVARLGLPTDRSPAGMHQKGDQARTMNIRGRS